MADRDEPIEIVKRIETPQHDIHEKEETSYVPEHINHNEEYISEDEKQKHPPKGIVSTLLGITTIGVIGFFGFNYLNNEHNNQIQSQPQIQTIKTNITETKPETEIKEPKETTTYIEELAVKREAEKIEESVIATLSAQQQEQQEAQAQQKQLEELEKQIQIEPESISKPILITKKKEIKEDTKKIVEKKVVVQKKKIKINKYKLHYETIKPRVLTVKKGDSLASIAKRFYGNAMDFKRIIRANPRIKSHKTALRLGEKIIIPRKDNKKTRRFIIVQKGNTLASISKNIYGSSDKVSKIIRANYKIKSKSSTLRLGQKIYVPK